MSDCCCNAPTIEVGLPGPPGPEGPEGPEGPQGPPGDPQALNPAGCNAAQNTASGLLVPETNLVAMPFQAPNPVGTFRSADIVVANPGGCPDTWQIGARLSPVFGSTSAGQQAINPNVSNFVNTALQLTLPQPGRYLVTFQVTGRLQAVANTAAPTNRWMQARAINVQTGGVVIGGRFLTQHRISASPTTAVQFGNLGCASLTNIIGVPAARTIRVQVGAFGSGGSAPITATMLGSYGQFHKITD